LLKKHSQVEEHGLRSPLTVFSA